MDTSSIRDKFLKDRKTDKALQIIQTGMLTLLTAGAMWAASALIKAGNDIAEIRGLLASQSAEVSRLSTHVDQLQTEQSKIEGRVGILEYRVGVKP